MGKRMDDQKEIRVDEIEEEEEKEIEVPLPSSLPE